MQVILVDHDTDPGLCAVDAKAADAIAAHIQDGPEACAQVSPQLSQVAEPLCPRKAPGA